jgi:hypothetical protein
MKLLTYKTQDSNEQRLGFIHNNQVIDMEDLVYRLRKRAEIRRQIPTRKSVQDNQPDRLSDLLEEAANEIERLNNINAGIDRNTDNKEYSIGTEEGYNEFVKQRNKE